MTRVRGAPGIDPNRRLLAFEDGSLILKKAKRVSSEHAGSNSPHGTAGGFQDHRRLHVGDSAKSRIMDAHSVTGPSVPMPKALERVHVYVAHDAGHVDHEARGHMPRMKYGVGALRRGDGKVGARGHSRDQAPGGPVDLQDCVEQQAFRTIGTIGDQSVIQRHGCRSIPMKRHSETV